MWTRVHKYDATFKQTQAIWLELGYNVNKRNFGWSKVIYTCEKLYVYLISLKVCFYTNYNSRNGLLYPIAQDTFGRLNRVPNMSSV